MDVARCEVKSFGFFLSLRLAASAFGETNLLDADPGSPTFNNPSFEQPATTFVSIVADKWELTGPRVIVDVPPYGSVPIVAGCGVFRNPATVPGGRIANADANQLAYIFSTSYNDTLTGLPTDHAFTQRIPTMTLLAGREYELDIGIARAQAQPSPDSVLTLSLFAYDPGNPSAETLLALESLTVADVNGLTLTDFTAITDPISGSNVGKSIGIRVTTHSNPSALPVQTSFDFDNVRLSLPEPGLYWDGNGASSGAGTAPAGTWGGTGGTSSNWTRFAAGTSATAAYTGDLSTPVFFSAGSDATGDFTVTLAGTQAARSLHFQEGAVTLAGGQITLGSGVIDVAAGSSARISSVVTSTAGLHKSGAGTLTLDNNFTSAGAVTISAGVLRLLPGSTFNRVIKTPSLSITPGSLDLGNNKLIVTTPNSTGTWNGSAYTGVAGLIASGRNGPALPLWDGGGIVTSQSNATDGNLHSIGIARADEVIPATGSTTALWAGQTITGSDTLVMYTYGGDANLDGKLNIDDYVRIDQGIAAGFSGWSNGDFNYDGKINIDDYTTVIDSNIGNQNGFAFPASGGIEGMTAVPEPAAAGLVGFLALRRRRSASKR